MCFSDGLDKERHEKKYKQTSLDQFTEKLHHVPPLEIEIRDEPPSGSEWSDNDSDSDIDIDMEDSEDEYLPSKHHGSIIRGNILK